MAKVLLTGGSGFIASHIIDVLLARGYTVVTTVRSMEKAEKIGANHPDAGDKLQFAIVKDVAQAGAFDEAVVSSPPFDYVLHTASPFHYNISDSKKDLIDPAVLGTTGILASIKKAAPSVKRVVVTSSQAAIGDHNPDRKPIDHVYSEADWNGITMEEAMSSGDLGYRASKTYAERAAWDFMEKEKPSFDLATCNPPLVFGPIHPGLQTLESLNTSNQRVRDMLTGAMKEKLPPTGGAFSYVDVRDAAVAHVNCLEKPDAGGNRFYVIGGYLSNAELARVVKKNLPQFAHQLPDDLSSGELSNPHPGFNNEKSIKMLDMTYRDFETTMTDTAKSIAALIKT